MRKDQWALVRGPGWPAGDKVRHVHWCLDVRSRTLKWILTLLGSPCRDMSSRLDDTQATVWFSFIPTTWSGLQSALKSFLRVSVTIRTNVLSHSYTHMSPLVLHFTVRQPLYFWTPLSLRSSLAHRDQINCLPLMVLPHWQIMVWHWGVVPVSVWDGQISGGTVLQSQLQVNW